MSGLGSKLSLAAVLLLATAFLARAQFDCDAGCDLKFKPVCGEDDVTYQNECLAFCQDVAVARPGNCGGGAGDKPSFVKESGKATAEVMKRFDADGFVFTGLEALVERTPADVEDTLSKAKPGKGPVKKIVARRLTPEGLVYTSSDKRQGLVVPPEMRDGSPHQAPARRSLRGSGGPGDGAVGRDAAAAERDLSVIGSDQRLQVTNPTAYPQRTHGQVDVGCSGAVVSPNAVLTAGHCVHGGAGQTWYTNINFSPGRYRTSGGSVVSPYGTWTWQFVTTFGVWTTSSDSNYDMAVINYRRNSSSQQLGDVVGWLGMSSNACPTPSTTITTHGYPGDKPAGSMWYVPTCPPLTWACGAYTATSTCDTYPGQSGSAMWVASTYVAYGNHIQGLTTYNRHCMLNSAKWPSIYAWAYQKPT